jgi:hypothetical protein
MYRDIGPLGPEFNSRFVPEWVEIAGLQAEHRDAPVVQENLAILCSAEYQDVVTNESVGGNAASAAFDGRRVQCAGVNGCLDPTSGKIVALGNEIDAGIIDKYANFTLRVGYTDVTRGFTRLIDVYFRDHVSQQGKQNLMDAAILKNEVLKAEDLAWLRRDAAATHSGKLATEASKDEVPAYTRYRSRPRVRLPRLFRR